MARPPGTFNLQAAIFNPKSLAGVAVVLLYLGGISELTFVDLDTWHEMALFREALKVGWIPYADHFAYTPTVAPSVQHEWGTGAVMYLVAMTFGAAGIMAFKYLLVAMIAVMCYFCARRQGASAEVFFTIAPLVLTPLCLGFTSIRAQVFTLLFLALFFLCLDRDRNVELESEPVVDWEGLHSPTHSRSHVFLLPRWLYLWLPAYLVWLNLHAGFVVALILLGLHLFEQFLRHRPVKHLLTGAVVMLLLVFVNPYGWYYPIYLWHALRMDRSMIIEWQPLWRHWESHGSTIAFVFLSVGLVLYAGWVRGFAHLPGVLMVLACAYAGSRHFRHLSVFALAWLCFAPVYLEGTRLGQRIRGLWKEQKAFMAVFWLVVALFGAYQAVHNRFWELRVPFRETPHYPVGAVAYLDEQHFHGHIVVPFEMGAYVSWKLYPPVRVSIDSRFEVAYRAGVLEEHMAFFSGQPGWREFLHKYPTDAVLLDRGKPVVALLMNESDWPAVYEDDFFVVFARAGLNLAKVDRRGQDMDGTFP